MLSMDNNGRVQKRLRSLMILAAALALFLISIIVLLLYRRHVVGAAGAQAAEAYLIDYHGHTRAASYKLDARPTLLGRVAGKHEQAWHCIAIPAATIGRRHARIEYKEQGYWIADLGSINGTFVNGRRIGAALRLQHGDRLRLHRYEFEFIMPKSGTEETTVLRTASAKMQAAALPQGDQEEQAGAALDLDLAASVAEEEGGQADTKAGTAAALDEALMPQQATADAIEDGAERDLTLSPENSPLAAEGDGEQGDGASAGQGHFDLTGANEVERK